MAFILDLGLPAPIQTFVREGYRALMITTVGFDDSEPITYSLLCGLEPQPGGAAEFYFFLRAENRDVGDSDDYWCAAKVARLMSKSDRRAVLAALCESVDAMLRLCRPERVQCVTYDADPPDVALEKYVSIFRVFESHGYQCRTADSFYGKRAWWLSLSADE